MAKMNLITKEDLIKTNSAYWNIVRASEDLLKRENAEKTGISVDEIHVDPEEDYVFVSWRYWNENDNNRSRGRHEHVGWDDGWRETSTTYKINKFLSLINKGKKVDPNDRIPVELKGVNK